MRVILSGSCYFTSLNDGGEQKIVGFSLDKKARASLSCFRS